MKLIKSIILVLLIIATLLLGVSIINKITDNGSDSFTTNVTASDNSSDVDADTDTNTNTDATTDSDTDNGTSGTTECTTHTYDYNNITWTWASDYSSCTATVYCTTCGNEYTQAATITSVINSQATYIKYTATVTVDGTDYTNSKTVAYSQSM